LAAAGYGKCQAPAEETLSARELIWTEAVNLLLPLELYAAIAAAEAALVADARRAPGLDADHSGISDTRLWRNPIQQRRERW
jgi:hypothetical protein